MASERERIAKIRRLLCTEDGIGVAAKRAALDEYEALLRRAEPTPEALEAWAEWFDDPNKSPAIGVQVGGGRLVTPGAILREIARRMRAAKEE